MEDFKKFYYAHRGLHDNGSTAPENSLTAFKLAVENGYGIELDVYFTKEGKLVVHHDFTLRRSCGKNKLITTVREDELNSCRLFSSEQTIPLFDDVLDVVGGKTPLIIEIKCLRGHVAVCKAVHERMKSYDGLFCIESFNPKVVEWFFKNAPHVIRGQLADFVQGRILPGMFKRKKLGYIKNSRPHFIAYNIKYLPNKYVLKAKEFLGEDTAIVSWTIRNDDLLKRAKKFSDILIFENVDPKKEF